MRFDAHFHLGTVYDLNRKNRRRNYHSIGDVIDYFDKNKVTHCVGIYIPSDKDLVKQIIDRNKAEILPFLWVSTLEEKFEPGFDIGIKLHPFRNHKFGKLDFLSEPVINYLKKLPDYTNVILHTQELSFTMKNSFFAVMKLAQKFPKLKFIINHMGSTGEKAKLPDYRAQNYHKMLDMFQKYVIDSVLVYGAGMTALMFDNVYCESSTLVSILELKIKILSENPYFLKKMMIGSDKPIIGHRKSIRQEESMLKKFLGLSDDDIEQIHQRAYDYIINYKPDPQEYLSRKYSIDWLDSLLVQEKKWKYIPIKRRFLEDYF